MVKGYTSKAMTDVRKLAIDPGKSYQDLLNFYQSVLNEDRVPFKAVRKQVISNNG